jgi:3-oxoadipate enol-lactonase
MDYFSDGDVRNPTLVLIHRGGTLHRMWEPQLAPLAERYHVIAPDLYYPGKWGDFTVAQAADDVLGLVAELVEWPVVLVGMSLGSAVAMQIAVNAPERVSGMVLGAPRVRVPNGAMRTNRLIMQLLPRKMVERSHVRSHRSTTDDLSEEAEQDLYRIGRPGLLAASRAMEGIDFSDALPDMTMPIRIVIGQYGSEQARSAATIIARRAPDAHLHMIEDAGNSINLDQPEAFTHAITEFVDSL